MRDTLNHIEPGSVSGGDFLQRSLFLRSFLVLIAPEEAVDQAKR